MNLQHKFGQFCLFGLVLYIPVYSYGHVRRFSSPNHTFSWASLTKQLVNKYFVHILSLVTDNNPSWISGREENGRRNYFMINLCKSMGLGQDWIRDPWINSLTHYGTIWSISSDKTSTIINISSDNIFNYHQHQFRQDLQQSSTSVQTRPSTTWNISSDNILHNQYQ